MLRAQGKFEQGMKIMTEGSGHDVPEDIREKEPHVRIQLFCEVANIKISQYVRAPPDQRQRGELLLEASKTIDKARVLDAKDQMVLLSDAYLNLAQVHSSHSPCLSSQHRTPIKRNVMCLTSFTTAQS